MNKLFARQKGFGLLEVMFSTGIFIMVVGSLVALSRLSLRNASLSAHRTQAITLAEDGLEAVRQMRDTTWIQNISRALTGPAKNWLTYPDCNNGYPADGVVFSTANTPSTYAICYDATSFTPGRFGVKSVTPVQSTYNPNSTTNDKDIFVVLKAGDGNPDPNAPAYYRRIVSFLPIASSTKACPAVGATDLAGLQILGLDEQGKLCTLDDIESNHFVKVKVVVDWVEFDKPWQVELNTILTNWRPR